MIIVNGTIEIKRPSGRTLDPATGLPTSGNAASWDDTIPCQWTATRYDATAHRDAERVTEQSYAILVEEQPDFAAERVRLRDNSGRTLGEFSVKSIEPLEAVGQIRISV